jgi:ankyrin repeat protein
MDSGRHEPDNHWLSALHIAAQKGHGPIVRLLLLQHSMDCNEPDSDGLTPLMHATIGGHADVVASLLSHGARIGKTDHQGRSALHHAVIHRRASVLTTLLDHCADEPGVVDGYDAGGRTALHTAVDVGFEPAVQALVQRGADLHSRARKDT